MLALAKFVYQDTMHLAYPVNDLAMPWVTARIFAEGKNPYSDTREFAKIWDATGAASLEPAANSAFMLSTYARAYPPTTMLLLAPLQLFPWHAVVWVYLIASAIFFVWMLLVLVRKLPLPWRDPLKLLFVAFALAMAPLHSGIHEVNLNTVIVACLFAGAGLMSRRPCLSGVAIAIAMCLKPQVAIFFFLYPWLRKKWKTAWAALAVCAAVALASVAWMKIHHVEWLRAFLAELSRFAAPDGRSSASAPGPGKFQLLYLQVLTFQFTHNPKSAALLSWAIFALLAAVAAYLIWSRVADHNESAGIAIVSILTLLPLYQRYYAAEVLVFVLYWAVANWSLKSARASVVLMLPLLFPFAAWAEKSGLAARFLEGSHGAFGLLWNDLVMPHAIWIELALLVILMVNVSRQTTRPRVAQTIG